MNRKRNVDTAFAANAAAQLDFVVKSSPYYEKGHNLYPVFRLLSEVEQAPDEKRGNGTDYRNKNDE
ncbi:MAG: hypothetical protein IT257_00505 [Chitinophagaceae bacterium]|nr:hypothetical protein [Chitinophagaceae bacterium]